MTQEHYDKVIELADLIAEEETHVDQEDGAHPGGEFLFQARSWLDRCCQQNGSTPYGFTLRFAQHGIAAIERAKNARERP